MKVTTKAISEGLPDELSLGLRPVIGGIEAGIIRGLVYWDPCRSGYAPGGWVIGANWKGGFIDQVTVLATGDLFSQTHGWSEVMVLADYNSGFVLVLISCSDQIYS